MYRTIFIVLFLISFKSFSQNTPLSTLQNFFKGMNTQDTVLIKSLIMSNVSLETIASLENKMLIQPTDFQKFIKSVGNKNPSYTFEEVILNYDKIVHDNTIALAWLPYKLLVNDKINHCGINTITLINDNNDWKILRIIDTRNKTNCE